MDQRYTVAVGEVARPAGIDDNLIDGVRPALRAGTVVSHPKVTNDAGTVLPSVLHMRAAVSIERFASNTLLDEGWVGRRDAADSAAFQLNAAHLPVFFRHRQPGHRCGLQPAIVDEDNDAVTVASPKLPSWLSIRQINGVWALVGKPTELNAGTAKFQPDVNDGLQFLSRHRLPVGQILEDICRRMTFNDQSAAPRNSRQYATNA